MYYIRKLSKESDIERLLMQNLPDDIPADFISQNMRTHSNTLSVWRTPTLDQDSDEYKDAIRAALLAGTDFNKKSQFLIISDNDLAEYDIRIDDSEIGETGYKGHGNLHSNICQLTFKKLGDLIRVFSQSSQQPERRPVISKAGNIAIISELLQQELIDFTKLNGEMYRRITEHFDKG